MSAGMVDEGDPFKNSIYRVHWPFQELFSFHISAEREKGEVADLDKKHLIGQIASSHRKSGLSTFAVIF